MDIRSVVKKIVPTELFRKIEPLGHWGEAVAENIVFGFPSRGLKVIGVTGTDGKTSTSTLITQMLRNAGYKVAMMTTISVDYGDGKGEIPNPTRLTTMGSKDLLQKIKRIKQNNVDYLVLETTSHALAQHRVWGVPYTVSAMTNVGHEHLDYHKTFERYRDAKRMLFKQTNANKNGLQIGIANADDPSGDLFASDIANPVTYGIKKGDLRATDIKLTPSGSTYTARIAARLENEDRRLKKIQTEKSPIPNPQSSILEVEEYKINCHLPGSFNVYNSLAAVGVGRALGLTKEQIEKGIDSLKSVEGRMTRVDEGQDFAVIVDYAHTPESFDKILDELRPLTKGKMIAVFGSAGRRDEVKRAQQGKIAGKHCDVVIATEEDDRDIDGQEILDQIASGAVESGKIIDKDLYLIHDREKAVEFAINMAKKGDIVVLLGKGHEKSILYNGPDAAKHRKEVQNDSDPKRVLKRDYDEVTVARTAIKAKNPKVGAFTKD